MEPHRTIRKRWLIALAVLSLLLAGCAGGSASGPSQGPVASPMEDLLTQAGFKTYPESSPTCQRVCQKMPAEQLVPHKKGDKLLYAYYAPGAKLLYVGDEAAYQRFINLAVVKDLAPRRRAVMETVPNDPEFWTMWQNMQGGP